MIANLVRNYHRKLRRTGRKEGENVDNFGISGRSFLWGNGRVFRVRSASIRARVKRYFWEGFIFGVLSSVIITALVFWIATIL